MASVGRCQQLPPCPMEPMPAGSQTDPLLAKAEPGSDAGSASGITGFKRGKVPAQEQLQGERGGSPWESNSPAAPQARAGGGRGGSRRRSPWGSPRRGRLCPQLRGVTGSRPPPAAPGTPCWGRGCPEEAVSRGQPVLEQLLAGPVAPRGEEPGLGQGCWKGWGPRLEPAVPEGRHPWGDSAGAFHEELQPVERLSLRSLWRTVSCGRDPMLEQERSVRSLPLRRKEQQRQL